MWKRAKGGERSRRKQHASTLNIPFTRRDNFGRTMQIKLFSIPQYGDDSSEEELNRFLRAHRIVEINKQFVPESRCWAFCVTYLEGSKPEPTATSTMLRKTKIDWKSQLSEKEFDRFAKMRVLRKQLAESEGCAAYMVLTDAEMAKIATLENPTLAMLRAIDGLGEKRVEKYGQIFINLLLEEDTTQIDDNAQNGESI